VNIVHRTHVLPRTYLKRFKSSPGKIWRFDERRSDWREVSLKKQAGVVPDSTPTTLKSGWRPTSSNQPPMVYRSSLRPSHPKSRSRKKLGFPCRTTSPYSCTALLQPLKNAGDPQSPQRSTSIRRNAARTNSSIESRRCCTNSIPIPKRLVSRSRWPLMARSSSKPSIGSREMCSRSRGVWGWRRKVSYS